MNTVVDVPFYRDDRLCLSEGGSWRRNDDAVLVDLSSFQLSGTALGNTSVELSWLRLADLAAEAESVPAWLAQAQERCPGLDVVLNVPESVDTALGEGWQMRIRARIVEFVVLVVPLDQHVALQAVASGGNEPCAALQRIVNNLQPLSGSETAGSALVTPYWRLALQQGIQLEARYQLLQEADDDQRDWLIEYIATTESPEHAAADAPHSDEEFAAHEALQHDGVLFSEPIKFWQAPPSSASSRRCTVRQQLDAKCEVRLSATYRSDVNAVEEFRNFMSAVTRVKR